MPPDEIDSVNSESLKGLVLSLLAKIDDLHEHDKAQQARIDQLLARIDELLAQLKQLASLTGNFCGARAQKRESNQRRLIANRL